MTRNLYRLSSLFLLSALLSTAGPCLAQDVSVTGVSFALKDSNVVVNYDLSGPADKLYKVVLTLRRQGDPGFRFTPIQVSGDVGNGKFEGPNRKIIWRLYSDLPDGLFGNDFYFQVTATLLEHGGGATWLYYVGGALVLGGAAAVLVLKKNGTSNSSTETGSLFPVPPSRP